MEPIHFACFPLAVVGLASTSLFAVQDSRPDPWIDKGPEVHNHGMLMDHHKFTVVAHRANHVHAPENSLQGIRDAIKVGADYVELDLMTTKDVEIVMMHDDKVDRTTDGHGAVRDLALTEIRALHFKFHQDHPEPVPTLDEVLNTVGRKVRIYMDIKAVTPAQVLPYLQRHRTSDHVIAYCYGPNHVEQWRSGAPKIPVISDFDLRTPDQIEAQWKAHPFAIFDGPARDLSVDAITTLHRLHVLVWPDIQSSAEGPESWQKYIDMGVDGFQTDHPEALVQFLRTKGIR
ncbi:MAG: glycerophosphodiester phosphodiesterase family protein [Fimbriimonas sp.]|nr:glycerophosphodiester phosphodiesterase family protein [Fimbriimonas sp.]